MTLAAWWALCITCFIGAASPGPSLAVVLARRGVGSPAAGLACSWGHALGVGIYGVVTAFGLGLVLQQSPVVFTMVQLAGALYLLHMAYKIISGQSGFSAPTSKQGDWVAAAKDGFMVAFLNPKLIVFFTALFSQFVTDQLTIVERLGMASIAMVVDGVWYSLITLVLGAKATALFNRHARKLDIAFASVIAVIASAVLLNVMLSF